MSWLAHRWRTQQNAIRSGMADFDEPPDFWTQMALQGFPRSTSVSVSWNHSIILRVLLYWHFVDGVSSGIVQQPVSVARITVLFECHGETSRTVMCVMVLCRSKVCCTQIYVPNVSLVVYLRQLPRVIPNTRSIFFHTLWRLASLNDERDMVVTFVHSPYISRSYIVDRCVRSTRNNGVWYNWEDVVLGMVTHGFVQQRNCWVG